jgi:hypothetical protein
MQRPKLRLPHRAIDSEAAIAKLRLPDSRRKRDSSDMNSSSP